MTDLSETQNPKNGTAVSGQVDPLVISLLDRLRQLTRYDVVMFDEGGGYMYQDVSQDEDGCWIRSSDVDDILRYFD